MRVLMGVVVSTVMACAQAPARAEPRGPAPDEARVPACVHWTAEARRRGLGYEHVVAIRNGCLETMECRVWTDRAPARQNVLLAPGQRREVVTLHDATSPSFRPSIECEPGSPS